jgi:uncharacterized membrane protein HdeD (DUF308 family)
MVNVRHGIVQIGYMLLAAWIVGWTVLVLWSELFRNPDWSEWPTFLAGLIGYPLGVFLLWRMSLWFVDRFIRPR